MRRKIIPTRLLAILLMVALFLGNDYTMYPLAEALSNQVNSINMEEPQQTVTEENNGGTQSDGMSQDSAPSVDNTIGTPSEPNMGDNGITDNGSGTLGDSSSGNTEGEGNIEGQTPGEGGDNAEGQVPGEGGNVTPGGNENDSKCIDGSEHNWVEAPETGEMVCDKCGAKPTPGEGGDVIPGDGENDNKCIDGSEHDWVEDPTTGKQTCSKCGAGKEQECEHEFGAVDPETGKQTCTKCGAQIDCVHDWVTDPDTGEEKCRFCNKLKSEVEEPEEECEHEWVTDPETGITICIKCGIEKEEECEHEWVTDPETGLTICAKCGIEKPCEHEWVRDPETLEVVCSICGEFNEDYVEEDECPESEWGFHIYEEKEDGTGYVCVLCGAEKETLDPLDVTVEMFMNSKYGISTMAATDNFDTRAGSDLPRTLEKLLEDGRTEIIVDCLGDLLVLQDISIGDLPDSVTGKYDGVPDTEGFEFEGYTITILQRRTGNMLNETSSNIWNITNSEFKGLGREEFPFSGTVTSYYKDDVSYTISTPFFNYISTKATVNYMRITGAISKTGTEPMGLVAGTLVKREGDDADCPALNEVVLNGSVSSQNAAGMIFGKVIAEPGTSITLPYNSMNVKLCPTTAGTVTGLHAGGFAGETIGDVTLDITDAGVTGNLAVYARSASNNTGDLSTGQLGSADLYARTPAGGMYVGAMDKGILKIAANTYSANVSKGSNYYGGASGGFVGMAIGTVVTTDEDGGTITVSGTVAGGIAGGVVGYYEHPSDVDEQILTLDHITVSATINAAYSSSSYAQYDYHAGGVVGRYYRDIEGATTKVYDTIDHITMSGAVRAYRYAGGVVGSVQGSNLKIGGEDAECIKVTGSVYNYYGSTAVGGVAGRIAGQYVEIQNARVSGTLYSNTSYISLTGGIVGSVASKSVIKITNANVTSSFGRSGYSDSNTRGGILGAVYAGSMVALDGTITVSMSFSTLQRFGRSGYIAGTQTEALIYFEPDVTYTHNSVSYIVDDIGSYGGVYRNGTWGESENVFSYEEAKVMGSVGAAGPYTIDSEADFIRLAVMLNTEGRFAADCFGYTPTGNKDTLPDAKTALMRAAYNVTKSLDLKKSGIFSLNRNDTTGFGQSFTGSFEGSGSDNIVIELGSISTHQAYVALFPYVEDGVKFKGFKLKRTINGATRYAAGIACKSGGNFTAEDVYVDCGITGFDPSSDSYWYDEVGQLYSIQQYYAGLVAYVTAGTGTTFKADTVKISGTLNATRSYSSYFGSVRIGGMVAYYSGTNATISVKDFELMNQFKITTTYAYRISGMITDITTSGYTTLSMTNITVHNGASIAQTNNASGSAGGWLGYTWSNVKPGGVGAESYSIKNIVIGDGGAASAGPQYNVYYSYGGLVNTVTGRIQLKNTKINNGVFTNRLTTGPTGVDGNGLLFRDGFNAIIEIDGYEIDGRPIDGSVTANNNNGNVQFLNRGANYDEIVAYNIGTSTSNFNDYKTGGIVNIIYNGFKTNHYVYQNRLVAPNNTRRTRYYYNLFGDNFENEDNYLGAALLTAGGTTVTNEKQMMIWHLSNYMNDSIRTFLGVYYTGGSISARNANTTFTGKMDLNTVSYYPTPVKDGTYTFSSEVVFYGQDITTKATTTMTPSKDTAEHYMLHAGLFISKEGDVTVRGAGPATGEINPKNFTFLTLSGSVSNLSGDTYSPNYVNQAPKNNSGAVFVRDITGKKNIYYVRFNGLYLADYTDEDPAGLMLGIVKDDTTLDISWIETVNYEVGKRAFAGKAASALIGVVGDYNASKISIEFKNMKLESRSDGNGIFMYASLIDENYYKEDTENPSEDIRRIRYLFTRNAFMGNSSDAPYFPFNNSKAEYGNNDYTEPYVTVGRELSDGIEYWDEGITPKGPEFDKSYTLAFVGNYTWTETGLLTDFIPYVHRDKHTTSKDIEVNPKNRSISEGCGTYEDPYIIDDAKQLMALARYLQNKDDYKYLGGWQIHRFESGRDIGNDGICNQDHPSDPTQDNDLKTYPNALTNGRVVLPDGFPTQEELCQAYYMIRGDVDLSSMTNSTDRQIAEDFVGLGTSRIPFRGVIVGKMGSGTAEEGKRPTLTLPYKSFWTDQSKDVNYGLIQNAIGAVVKDLIIKSPEDNDVSRKQQRTGVAKVENMAGGVMAIVIGGDNIIDNVTVTANVVLLSQGCSAGAYVGTVEQGSLILRNIPEACAQNFRIGSWSTATNTFTAHSKETLEKYEYVSGLVGKVEDGCVIYDDTFGGKAGYSEPVLDHAAFSLPGVYVNELLPISKHYDIIVKGQLDKDMNDDLIDVSYSNGEYTAHVDTSAQLQIVSMVINSDAFSIYAADGGYKEEAACRKANYNFVGVDYDTPIDGNADRNRAVINDDKIYYYPYLYQYFDFSGVNISSGDRTLGTSDWKATLKQGTFQKKTTNDKGEPITQTITGYVSTLNVPIYGVTEIMNYELKAGQTYNLAQYCRGFRGIGATYGMLESKTQIVSGVNYGTYDEVKSGAFYSDFRANFDGKNATIQLGMDKIYDQTIHTTALFNDLLDRDASKDDYFTIENIVVTGFSRSLIPNIDQTTGVDSTDGSGSYPNRTAAIVGMMRRPWRLKNISLTEMTVVGKGHTGGIVAWIEPGGQSGPTGSKISDYEITDCTLDENTTVWSYGGSAGGIVAIVTQNVPSSSGAFNVKLYGCQVKGTEDKQVNIEVRNKISDQFNDTGYSYDVSTQRGVGRSGGFIGYVGRKNAASSILDVNIIIGRSDDPDIKTNDGEDKDAEVVYANITGAYSTGGLIGTYDAGYGASTTTSGSTTRNVEIRSAKVNYCEVVGTRGNINNTDYYCNYGVGGLIGEMRAYSLKIQPGANQKISLDYTNVTSSQNPYTTATNYQSGYGMYAGGVVGCIKVYTATFADITMDGHQESNHSDLQLGGQVYTVKSARSDAGGIVGFAAYGSGAVNMSNITVKGMNITVDYRTEEQIKDKLFATYHPSYDYGRAGGLIGTNQMNLIISGSGAEGKGATVEDCMITGAYYGVGGIVGGVERYTGSSYTATRSEDIEDVVVQRNIIGFNTVMPFAGNASSAVAGGVYGMVDSTYGSGYWGGPHRVENARIKDNWIYGFYAGGVLGYGSSYQYYYSNMKDTDNIVVENNDMYGRYVGGAIGTIYSGNVQYMGTNIKNNRLQAYGTGSSSSAYVGGFAGYIGNTYSTSYTYRLDLLKVESNDILAGNTDTNKSIYAGGLFGWVSAYTNYVYQPKLTDNLIGYSESASGAALRSTTSGAGFATIQALFNSTDGEMHGSRTVSLIQGTSDSNLKAVSMPSVDDLRNNGIGNYSSRIGNFVGYYGTGTDYHTYILAPELTYSKTFNNTRPVIDVGRSNTAKPSGTKTPLTDYPYEYRSYIYIIYHEPESSADNDAALWNQASVSGSTGGTNWTNLFEGISYAKLMNAYINAKTTNSISDYLDAYRLSVTVNETQDYEKLYTNLYRGSDGLKSPLYAGASHDIQLPVIMLDTQYGTPDELMKGIVASLTGVGGAYCDDDSVYSNGTGMGLIITDMHTERWLVTKNGGEVKKDTDTSKKPSLKATKSPDTASSRKWELTYWSSSSYDDDGYDLDDDDASGSQEQKRDQTFTMLYITYSWQYPQALKSGNSTVTRSRTLRIPIFAQERLNIDTHLKVVEGLQYNAEKVKESGYYDTVLVVSDSSYTFYSEYIYGGARTRYNGITVGKHIGTYVERDDDGDGVIDYNEAVNFPTGARLTLIDIDDNNKVYYYTVDGTENKKFKDEHNGNIPFTAFKNAAGEPYKYKDISKDDGFMLVKGSGDDKAFKTWDYERNPDNRDDKTKTLYKYNDVAVERFLITVDTSSVDAKDIPRGTGTTRFVDYNVEITNAVRAKTTLTEHTLLRLTIQEGVTIKFMNKKYPSGDAVDPDWSEQTYIDGYITANEESGYVDIWATIEISAPMPFWYAVQQNGSNMIDSSNHDKYLELQIYMTDFGGTEEITLPSGSYGYIEGKRTAPEKLADEWFADQSSIPVDHIDRTSLDPYYNTSNIFYYKDGRLRYELNDLTKVIMAELARGSNINGSSDVLAGTEAKGVIHWVNHMRLDFRNADMTPFTQDRYDMHINLLRIEDANYPVGGEIMDVYSNDIQAARSEDLACALEAEDLMQLGINTYDNQTQMLHVIDADYKMDFTGVITKIKETDEQLAEKHYTVAYRIWQKEFAADGKSYVYVPYNGDQLDLKLVNDPDKLQLTSAKTKSEAGEELNFWYVDYKFTWDEIKNGTKVTSKSSTADSDSTGGTIQGDESETTTQKEYVILRDLTVTVKDAYVMDLSNYKVQAILYVNDDDGHGAPTLKVEDIDLDSITPLSDFFVFTVAKLKTDMDY